jgi:hypothetical protein
MFRGIDCSDFPKPQNPLFLLEDSQNHLLYHQNVMLQSIMHDFQKFDVARSYVYFRHNFF